MHNPYFKPPSTGQRPFKQRSPTPPRRFVEPLSPSKPRTLEPQFNYPPLNAHVNFTVRPDTSSASTPKPRAQSISNGYGHQRTPSTIDALADAALGVTPPEPIFSERVPRYNNGRPHARAHGATEPPHKRARSEYIPPTQLGSYASRPATSYGWQQGSQLNGSAFDPRVEEAALLLNFKTGGWPSNHTSPVPQPPLDYVQPRHHARSFPQETPIHPRPTESGLLPAFVPQQYPQYNRTAPPSGVYHDPTILESHERPSVKDVEMMDKYHTADAPPGALPPHLDSEVTFRRDSIDISASEQSETRPKARRGWPRGKPRGPRSRQSSGAKTSSRRTASKITKSKKSKKGSSNNGNDESQQVARRNSFSDWSVPRDVIEPEARAKSVPREIQMVINETTRPTRRKANAAPDTICAGCSTLRQTKKAQGDLDEWIRCNGCNSWFHTDCAGFKRAVDVRDVDKYFCVKCEPEHGKTTHVRKSKRAHTSVDYAELQRGNLRTGDDSVEHHYIQPIKDGGFQFDPETFPRMRPELITREFFEKSGTFVEPICIPAEWNPRPWKEGKTTSAGLDGTGTGEIDTGFGENVLPDDFEYDEALDVGQDRLGMVMPEELTVRQVCNLVGSDYPLDVIDVKTQNSGAKWTLSRWADYYEEIGDDKAIRNVISLEVSQTRLGRLLQRPKVVRDIDLQDEVWPQEETDKGKYPKVQFYCLMSIADSYTDFHIDFGGSSVYYHILRGSKTFFFIPPKPRHLKAYEEWNDSPHQNYTFLPSITKECYRVDLHEGDTMLIPSGWIHAVWTPADSLVIGGNFLTRMSFKNQFRVAEIEKNNETPLKFRYPFFQRLMWYTAIQYLEKDPLPAEVSQLFLDGKQFERQTPIWDDFDGEIAASDTRPGASNARYYSEAEADGLPDLANFIFRTVMMTMGRVEGISQDRMKRVNASIPKGKGEPLEIAKAFALWVAWKRGNEDPPAWAHPDAVLPNDKEEGQPKKLSARALKDMERKEAIDAWRLVPDRQSARVSAKHAAAAAAAAATESMSPAPAYAPAKPPASSSVPRQSTEHRPVNGISQPSPVAGVTTLPGVLMSAAGNPSPHISTPKTSVLGPKRIACDACRKRRIRCKHKDLVQQVSNGTPYADGTPDAYPSTHPSHSYDPFQATPPKMNGFAPLVANPSYTANTVDAHEAQPSDAGAKDEPYDYATTSNGASNGAVTMMQNGVGLGADAGAKRGRTKACVECRKSKRRCVHDENGNVDPVKAAETPVPRGSIGRGKRHSTDMESPVSVKKQSKSISAQSDHEQPNGYGPPPPGFHEPSPYEEPGANLYDGRTAEEPALDPSLFTSHESHRVGGATLHAQPHVNGQGFQLDSLEQIANEVLDMNGREADDATRLTAMLQQQAEQTVSDGTDETPAVSGHMDGSVDSGVSLTGGSPEDDSKPNGAEPNMTEFDGEGKPVPDLITEGGAVQNPAVDEQPVSEKPETEDNDIPLYQPPAPLSKSPEANKRAEVAVNEASRQGSETKRKRESASSTPVPKSVKKAKLEGSAVLSVQESEDERLAKLLQAEDRGLRRRS